MKLLVVDDEIKIRAVIKEYAEFEGYDIDEAGDGMEAIAKCKATDYDLIIMEWIFCSKRNKESKKHSSNHAFSSC